MSLMKNVPRPNELGFSLVEMAVVVVITLIMTAMALFQIMPSMQKAKADAGFEIVLGQIRRARQRAMDERRTYRVSLVAPRTLQVHRADVDGGGNQIFVLTDTFTLPVDLQFTTVAGFPSSYPDGFGTGNAIDFGVDYGGGQTQLFFQPDGTVLDSASRLNSGVVYIARPADLMSGRAVSVWGATGRVKGWHIVKKAGVTKWEQ